MYIRNVNRSDFDRLHPVVNDWWGGRDMAGMLPKLFFEHFNDTSFVVEADGKIIGFLIGFLSQSNHEEAYIHFVGINPSNRQQGIAKKLYDHFFQVAKAAERMTIRCITSPVNQTSIAYHTSIGFEIKAGDKTVDGIPVHSNYDGTHNDRVLFVKRI